MSPITRREFLQSGALSLAALALPPGVLAIRATSPRSIGRIARRNTPVHAQPDPGSPRVEKLGRDTLVNLLEELESPAGPAENPRWYRIDAGYLHSAYVQRIGETRQNPPLSSIPEEGVLGEVTVPYSETTYFDRQGYSIPLYRLYYRSIHWITDMKDGEIGEPLYRLTDERLRVHYWTRAQNIRPIKPEEFAPLPASVPPEAKRLEVSIARQILTAYEGRSIVREMKVSTGKRFSPTPAGQFRINRKYPNRHMGDGALTSDLRAYELVGTPWVSFFGTKGIAFHGAYWHDNFGVPMSMGCVNMRIEDALWLFRWTAPTYQPEASDRPTWKVTADGGTAIRVI